MKKLLTLFIAFTLVSCNDGDFDVPEFEFTDEINACGIANSAIFYITSSAATETMAMTLFSDELGITPGTEEYPISSSLQVVYRLFDDGITSSYYCQAIPPTTPTVVRELLAQSGTVIITTSEIKTEDVITGYKYEIIISDLLFVEGDERLFFETFQFGEEYIFEIEA